MLKVAARCWVISTAMGTICSVYMQTIFCITLVRSSFSVSRIIFSSSRAISLIWGSTLACAFSWQVRQAWSATAASTLTGRSASRSRQWVSSSTARSRFPSVRNWISQK
uniref:Putative secreted protein n=1 Tax=Ixodes ricinus TaxID=34613 RepID=A0A6B0UH33_IXORI